MANELIVALASVLSLFATWFARKSIVRAQHLETQLVDLTKQIENLSSQLTRYERREKRKRGEPPPQN